MFIPLRASHHFSLWTIMLFIVCIVGMMLTGVGNAEVPSLGDRALSLGSWGADVFQLQQALIRFGYDLIADGHFGRETHRAVLAFQLAYDLKPDGIVGSTTAATLLSLRPTREYIVVPGDSLWAIARRFDTTIDTLMRINSLSDGPLRVGTRLNVPIPLEYKIQPGDTLSGIAQRYGTTVTDLAKLNQINDVNRIRVGMTLRLPSDVLWITPNQY